MENTNNKSTAAPRQAEEVVWRGFTLEEIQYQKALTLVRIEMQKERLIAMKSKVAESVVPTTVLSGIMEKFSTNKGIIAYAFAGFKLYKIIKGIYQKFRSCRKAG